MTQPSEPAFLIKALALATLADEEGQARDVEWKMRVAHRIHHLAVNHYGLEPSDLIFDALTFPLSTGDEALRGDAMATIEAIKRIKTELPGVFTVLGVSNVSFGLNPASRHVLNSVFLHECRVAGLDAAIVTAILDGLCEVLHAQAPRDITTLGSAFVLFEQCV